MYSLDVVEGKLVGYREYLSGDVGITVIDLRTDEILVYDEVVNSED